MSPKLKEENLRATIISIYPLDINEFKPGLYPGWYHIPAAPEGDISYLVVGDAIFYTENKNEQTVTVRTPFHVLAESIVGDFQVNHIARIVGDENTTAEPGVFFVPGAWEDRETIKLQFAEEINEAYEKQMRWFAELTKIADDVYGRTRRHSSVSNLQRIAGRRLNLQRPWLIDTTNEDKCPFCKASMPYGAVKCPNCREITNRAGYEALVKENEEAFNG